jgi:competence protein ComEC
MYYFHQFSNYFLITNYLLIPVSTIAIWLVVAVFIFSPLTAVATFLTKILAFTIKTMNFFATGIESLPFSVTTDIQIDFSQLVILYFVIAALAIFFFNTKMYRHLYIAVAAVVVYVSIGLVGDFQNRNQKYFIVYNINKVTAINIIEGRKNVVLASLDSTTTKQIEFSAKNNWLKKGLESEKYINLKSGQESVLSNVAATDNTSVFYKRKLISFGSYKAIVVEDDFGALILDENYKKPKVDYLILSNNPNFRLAEMLEYFDFKQIIISSSNSQKNIDKWNAENDSLKLDIFDVAEKGAFVLSY